MQDLLKKHWCECKQCGAKWEARKEHPKECVFCRSRAWDKEVAEPVKKFCVPVPKIDHSEIKTLPFIGARCPYCGGTTGINGYRCVVICYSCDAVFSITEPMKFLGVIAGIGVR